MALSARIVKQYEPGVLFRPTSGGLGLVHARRVSPAAESSAAIPPTDGPRSPQQHRPTRPELNPEHPDSERAHDRSAGLHGEVIGGGDEPAPWPAIRGGLPVLSIHASRQLGDLPSTDCPGCQRRLAEPAGIRPRSPYFRYRVRGRAQAAISGLEGLFWS